jgi:hypothetical protein
MGRATQWGIESHRNKREELRGQYKMYEGVKRREIT